MPPTYDASQPAPLLVLFHGAGQDARSWTDPGILEIADDFGTILLLPDSRSRTWDIIESSGFGPDTRFLDKALAHTFLSCNVDPARTGIGGFSDGASYALSVGITNGDFTRSIVAFSPGFGRAATERGTPRIFISHGVLDQVLDIRNARGIMSLLREGGYDVTMVEFDGGHELPSTIVRQAFAWFAAPPTP